MASKQYRDTVSGEYITKKRALKRPGRSVGETRAKKLSGHLMQLDRWEDNEMGVFVGQDERPGDLPREYFPADAKEGDWFEVVIVKAKAPKPSPD